jgi:hypothetical protein
MKRAALLLAIAVLALFGLLVVRETAAVVALARAFDPRLGQAVLWGLVALWLICLGVPAIMVLRLRAPLRPPALEAPEPVVRTHLERVARRLSRHPLVIGPVAADAVAIDTALKPLDELAEREMRKLATTVFVSTAISQSGRLDGLFVLVAQSRVVWKVARIYWQRPNARDLVYLYANVAASVFAAQALEDIELGEALEPIVPSVVEAAGLGMTVVFAPVATILADAMLQGTVNALLTLRVGCITRQYCRSLPVPDHRTVRRSASREAARLLPKLVAEPLQIIRRELAGRAGAAVAKAARSAVHQMNPFRRAGGA